MITNELGRQLHDKATRGAPLSAEEQQQLDEWYGQLDQEENVLLTRISPPQTLAELRTQVDAAVAQLATVVQQIQTLTAENEVVRGEIATLHKQLAQRLTKQPV